MEAEEKDRAGSDSEEEKESLLQTLMILDMILE